MADKSLIEWTDATWNIVTGCSVLSPGCTNCYAMTLAGTRLKHHRSRAGLTRDTKAGPVWTGDVRDNEEWLLQPLQWKRPRKIFVCAHGDLFHEKVPNEWLDRIFAVMALAPQHVFQVLTKRPERMRAYVTTLLAKERSVFRHAGESAIGWRTGDLQCAFTGEADRDVALGEPWRPLPNVWLGVSVEDQQRADERIPILLDTPAAVRWLSMEPLLRPVDLTEVEHAPSHALHALWGLKAHTDSTASYGPKVDWVVVGGESGPGARPMHPDWARSLRDQCAAAGVPFHFKQWGDWAPDTDPLPKLRDPALALQQGRISMYPDGTKMGRGFFPEEARNLTHLHRVGKKAAGRLLDGVEHNGVPAP